jgi:hypothetical protein
MQDGLQIAKCGIKESMQDMLKKAGCGKGIHAIWAGEG